MLQEIAERDIELLRAKEDLEERVKIRTHELEQEIIERKRAERQLAEVNGDLKSAVQRAVDLAEAAQAASRAKSEFLANVSHEIEPP